MMKVLLIAGARPNFMKIAPIYREALKHNQVQCKIVHTGQHYDYEMSEAFFEDLELPKPDFFLECRIRIPCSSDSQDYGHFRGALPERKTGSDHCRW